MWAPLQMQSSLLPSSGGMRGGRAVSCEQCASPCICLWIGQRGCMQQHAAAHLACVALHRCDCVLHADDCAGIDVECLHGDLYATQAGTSCRPLADGAACGAGGAQQCWRGVCAGGCVHARFAAHACCGMHAMVLRPCCCCCCAAGCARCAAITAHAGSGSCRSKLGKQLAAAPPTVTNKAGASTRAWHSQQQHQ